MFYCKNLKSCNIYKFKINQSKNYCLNNNYINLKNLKLKFVKISFIFPRFHLFQKHKVKNSSKSFTQLLRKVGTHGQVKDYLLL